MVWIKPSKYSNFNIKIEKDNELVMRESLSSQEEFEGFWLENKFKFDWVFGKTVKNRQIFLSSAKRSCDQVMKGYNSTIFVYGQTGTGKTYTMEGSKKNNEEGLIQKSISYIFNKIRKNK